MKSHSKHTPGPWKVAGEGIITNENGDEIDLAGLFDDPDAALIAAAPEMLEALELACEKLAHDQNFSRLELTVLLEKAIAKARGEL